MADLGQTSFYATEGQYLVGPKGDKGDTGPQGPIGPVGPAGAPGAGGVISSAGAGDIIPLLALLGTVPNPANGQVVYVSEPGRSGFFAFSSTNLAAKVTADPYRGLYVPRDTDLSGASGGWVRSVVNAALAQPFSHNLSWWNPTQLGNNGHQVVNSVAALLPSGATLVWDASVTVLSNVIFLKSVHILGMGTSVSRLIAAPGTNFNQTGLLMLRASHSSVRRIGFVGIETGYFSANPACVHVQKGYSGPAPTPLFERLIEDVEVSDCRMENTSLGIVFAADGDGNAATNNGVTVVPSNNLRAHHNVIITNMHGIEIFGSDKALIHDNRILPSPNPAAPQFSAGIRILGSEDYDVHDNRIAGLGYENNSRAAFRLSRASFAPGAYRPNRNGSIRNNTVSGTYTFCQIDESAGDLVIADNVWTESLTATTQTIAILFAFEGFGVDSVYVRNNTFKGVANYCVGTGPRRHFQSRDNTVVGNAAAPEGSGRVYNATYASAKLAEFIRDTFLMGNGGYDFKFKSADGCTLRVVQCDLPEAPAGTPMLDGDGTGTFIKSLGNGGEDATIGANYRTPAGLRAAIA